MLASSTGAEISSATNTDHEAVPTGDVSADTTGSATSTELKGTTTYVVFSDTASTSDLAITTIASADLSTSAVTLTSAGETTTETMTTEPSSTYPEESTTTLSEADTTTLAETTTTGLSETTTTAAFPLETFNLFTDREDWGLLMGSLSTTNQLGFQRRRSNSSLRHRARDITRAYKNPLLVHPVRWRTLRGSPSAALRREYAR